MNLARVDTDESVTVCYRGTRKLTLGSIGEMVLFVDGDLFELPLDCLGSPHRLASLAKLLGRKPRVGRVDAPDPDDSFLDPSFSPDGRRIAVTIEVSDGWTSKGFGWIGAADGSGWHAFGPAILGPWLGNDAIVTDRGRGRPLALDLATRSTRFLRRPLAVDGLVSPDGTGTLYSLTGPKQDGLERFFPAAQSFLVDNATGVQTPFAIPDAVQKDSLQSYDQPVPADAWSPAGVLAKVIGSRSDDNGEVTVPCALVTFTGAAELMRWPLADKVDQDCSREIAWLDRGRVWLADQNLKVFDLGTGAAKTIKLPGRIRDDLGIQLGSVLPAFDQRIASWNIVSSGQLPLFRDAKTNISFHYLPSWRVIPCACAPRPFTDGFVAVGEQPNLGAGGSGLELIITTTSQPFERTRRALTRKYAVGRTSFDMKELIDRLHVSTRKLGGVDFVSLDMHSEPGDTGSEDDTVYVGDVRGTTVVIFLSTTGRYDPAITQILKTIDFG